MSFVVIAPSQVAAKAPVDDLLMGTIKDDLDYLLSAITGSAALPFDFRVPVTNLLTMSPNTIAGVFKRLDVAYISKTQTLIRSKLYLETPANSGSLVVDARKYRPTATPILSIAPTYSDAVSSIGRTLGSLISQGVTRSTPQIATQSVALTKAAINILSVVPFTGEDGLSYHQFNLDASPDADWVTDNGSGTSPYFFTASGTASNDGSFRIYARNKDGGMNLVTLGAGVNEFIAAGTVTLNLWTYTYSNPVSSEFVAGESCLFAAHTSGGNNGTRVIHAINQGGNNIVAINNGGVAQAGVAGNANVWRFVHALLAPAPADFIVGQTVDCNGFPSGGNNGLNRITGVNQGGDNIVAYDTNGVVDATVGGNLDIQHFTVDLPTDPSGEFIVGDSFAIDGNGPLINVGFQVIEVNHAAANNLVFYEGTQDWTGLTGQLTHLHLKFEFDSDQSAIYSTASRVEVLQSYNNDGDYNVVEVNRGGGANFNVIVETNGIFNIISANTQAFPFGVIVSESRSIYATRPRIDFGVARHKLRVQNWINLTDNGVFNGEASLNDGDVLCFNIDQLPGIQIGGTEPAVANVMLQLG